MTVMVTAPRLAQLRDALVALQVDAVLITDQHNRRYLSGFTGSNGVLLISADRALIATDFRYYDQVALESPGFELIRIPTQVSDVMASMLDSVSVRRLAFEADAATYADVGLWTEAAPSVEWVPTKGIVLGQRAIKDAGEIALLRAAVALGDQALAAARATARPGMTELELAWDIESYIRTHGGESAAFELIVAAGANAARPHAHATNAPLLPGEPIVIDMGATVNGYRSDLTRTLCFGIPKDALFFWRVYNTVLEAQLAAEAALRPGLTGVEADAVARKVIADAGYGENFGHGLGHGVGLVIHELPRLGRLSQDTLAPGHVVTVEPGIYLPGWGGVRIEDVVLITENGAEVLSRAPKEPII